MTKIQNQLTQHWEQHSSQILATTINSLNETTARERSRKLSQFTTQALEKEILSRQNCQFNRLSCTNKAEDYIIKSQNPTCWNCKQDMASLKK
jgi:hypothetical protein